MARRSFLRALAPRIHAGVRHVQALTRSHTRARTAPVPSKEMRRNLSELHSRMLTRVPIEADFLSRSQFVAMGGRFPLLKSYQATVTETADSAVYTMRGTGDEFRVTCAAVFLVGVSVTPLLAHWYVSPVADWIRVAAFIGVVVAGVMIPWAFLKPERTTRLSIDSSTGKATIEHRRGEYVLDQERLQTDSLWFEIVRIRATALSPWPSMHWHGWMLTMRDQSCYWSILATASKLETIETYATAFLSPTWHPQVTLRPVQQIIDVDVSGMRAG